MEEIVSLCKRRGFIYNGSDVYGGLAGTWDYGPLGVELKKNIQDLWWNFFVANRDDMYGVDAAILMNSKVWQASGHVATFADPLVEDLKTKKRYRADHLLKDNGINAEGLSNDEITAKIRENNILSPDKNELSDVRSFNMMFSTNVGPIVSDTSTTYLRPETAQGIFTNYKNIVDSFYPDLPFGVAQQGKAFRNEISPRDFVFRSREFNQMEIEYFVNPETWAENFEELLQNIHEFLDLLELPKEKISEVEVGEKDRAHYSQRTVDIEYDYPNLGKEELLGLAYRGDFDLMNIQNNAKKSMEYIVKGGGDRFVPHVIEPSFGVERLVMAVLSASYKNDGERTWLALPKNIAPKLVVVSPLLKNKPELVELAKKVYENLKKQYPGKIIWDDSGNIGKRYAKADEVGIPNAIVIDFDSLENNDVSIRNRDTTEQIRVKIEDIKLV